MTVTINDVDEWLFVFCTLMYVGIAELVLVA